MSQFAPIALLSRISRRGPFRLSLAGVICLIATQLTAAAQQNPAKAMSVQAEAFAETIPVRNMPAAASSAQQGTGPAAIEKEINEENRLIIRHYNPNAKPSADQALSSKRSLTNAKGQPIAQPQALPTPSVNFEGMSQADTKAADSNQGFLPPDTNGAVGPNHYIQNVNVCFRVWNKSGAPVTATTSFVTLFSALNCGDSIDGDPIVLYDQLADRWLISEFCTVANPNDHQLIAVSKTNDPSGAYYLYDFPMPNNKFNDYPHLSVWADGYYMTDNQFSPSLNTFEQSGVFAFNRAKMLVGDPSASFVYFDTAVLFPPSTGSTGPDGIGGMLPANVDGYLPPAVGGPCPFVYFEATAFGDPADQLRIFDFHVDFNTPANSAFTERTGSPLPVAAFDPGNPSGSRNVVPEPAPGSSNTYLDAINDRIMFRLAYRNLGSSEALLLNHTVNAGTSQSYRAGVRWYELTRSSPSAAFAIVEQQTFAGNAGDTANRWMGSVAMNFQGDIAVGYSVSSTSVFPSIRYAAKLFTDPSGGGLAQGEQTFMTGAGAQESTSGRWGDYSCMTVDPADDCAFWYTQEYYASSGSSPWQTRIGKIVVGTQATSPRGTISGTITNCSTGQPLQNAIIAVSGGFWRASGADGTYSVTLAPGTYTATATAAGLPSVMSGNLVVTNGGNATFNACLQGLPDLSGGTATIASENFTPANGAPDPGEYVAVNLPISNTGSANTNSLIATLQANGGVINPSSPQNYGVVTAGGAAVSRQFSFVASGICGSKIALTLNLQDGATNLGTVIYTLPLGVLNSSPLFSEAFDGVSAPALPAGWTTTATGGETAWVTSSTSSNSSPNNATAPDEVNIGNTELVTPVINVPAGGGQLTFRNLFNLEADTSSSSTGYDGMVLEISINGGAYNDITSGGNNFITGGYTRTISTAFGSPIAGRPAWSGLSAGTTSAPAYISSTINLPSAAAGQPIHLKWRVACDTGSIAPGKAGARIDNISVTATSSVCVGNQAPQIVNGPPPSPLVVDSSYSFAFVASGNPTPTFSVSGTLPAGLSLSSAGVLSGAITNGGTGMFPNIMVTASNGVSPNASQTFSLATVTQVSNYLNDFKLTGNNADLGADPDGDGIANLLEYALGLDPTTASVLGLPVVTLKNYSGTKYLSMTFNRSSLATDITYIVQGSSDLVNWTALGTSSGGAVTTGPGFVAETGSAPTFSVEVRDTVPFNPNGNVTRFVRLKITSP